MIIPDNRVASFFGVKNYLNFIKFFFKKKLVNDSWGWRFYLIGGTLINTFITLFYEKYGIYFFVKMY